MSVYQKLINLDQVFRQLEKPPIIINDVQTSTEEEKAELNSKIYTLYDSGVMNTVAKCECGKLYGDYNLGVRCNVCDTEVTSPLYQNLEPLLWVRAPEGVAKLMNPHVWFILNKTFTISNFSLIRYLCETSYNPPRDFKEVRALESTGIKRGYNYFVENFHAIIKTLSELKTFTKSPKVENVALVLRMLNEFPDCIFCNYLPLPNRVLLVIEDTNVGRYVDNVYIGVIDAIQMIAGIDTIRTKSKKSKKEEKHTMISMNEIIGPIDENVELINLSAEDKQASPGYLLDNAGLSKKENRTVKMLHALAVFHNNYYRNNLGGKPGLMRKHIFSSRSNFSCRAVITSMTEPHAYNELHIPWTLAVGTLRYHILNKLVKRGFKANQALEFINSYARVYHPLMSKIFDELIYESVSFNPDSKQIERGIVVTLCRNPSLGRGSILRLRITKVIENPESWSLRLSILSVISLNADFDGDAVGLQFMLDEKMADGVNALAPHYNVFDIDKPRNLSNVMSIPKPVIANINNWYYQEVPATNTALMDRYAV